jgi:hypothetical protein
MMKAKCKRQKAKRRAVPRPKPMDEETAQRLVAFLAKQRRKRVVGPIVSFGFHAAAILLLCLFLTDTVREKIFKEEPILLDITMEELVVKEVEKLPELEPEEPEIDVEVELDELVMETPDIPAEFPDLALKDATDDPPQTDDNLETETSLDTIANNSPLVIPSMYGGRRAAGRAALLKKYGGEGTEDAVLRALRWLKSVQKEDGSWEGHAAYTGLALLTFLAHGETPLSEEFGVTVMRGLMWQSDHMISGAIKQGRRYAYTNAIATYSLAEAYAMTKGNTVGIAMEVGLEDVVAGQNAAGGYYYEYLKNERWDLSVAGWNYQALKAGYIAGAQNDGLSDAMQKSIEFLKTHAFVRDRFHYQNGGRHKSNMTGVGVVSLQQLGEADSDEVQSGLRYIMTERLKTYRKYSKRPFTQGGKHIYGWYYDTQAAFNAQGDTWTTWNSVFKPTLLKNQHPDGYWPDQTGKVTAKNMKAVLLRTTWCTLQLEVYYRHLPSYQSSNLELGRDGISSDDDDIELQID